MDVTLGGRMEDKLECVQDLEMTGRKNADVDFGGEET